MMEAKKTSLDFFHITFEHLKGNKIFPFQLYIFNPLSKEYTVYLFGNSPLTQEKSELLNYILERGGELAILITQKRTFLSHLELDESEIPSLMTQEVPEIVIERLKNLEHLQERLKTMGKFSLKEEMSNSLEQDNFLSMIELARDEIMSFPVNISHTVSLAAYLAPRVMNQDNFTNRIAAVAHFMAKTMDMNSPEALSQLFCASLFHHLGHGQLDLSIVNCNQIELPDQEKNSYRKHPGLTHHLLRKCSVELDSEVIQIILDHHERYDGRGYPNAKTGQHINTLALVLGAVSHIFEYSSGRITGSPVPMKKVIQNLREKTFSPGLEFEFGDTIFQALSYLINQSSSEQKAA